MKGLDSIIKVKRWALEEQRRKLAELHQLQQQIRQSMRALDDDMQRFQRDSVAMDPAVQFVFGSYVESIREKQATLNETLAEIDAAVIAATDELAGLYQDVKRVEIVRDRAVLAAKVRLQKREQDEMDQIGLLPFTTQESQSG